jgi:hypothetical protein
MMAWHYNAATTLVIIRTRSHRTSSGTMICRRWLYLYVCAFTYVYVCIYIYIYIHPILVRTWLYLDSGLLWMIMHICLCTYTHKQNLVGGGSQKHLQMIAEHIDKYASGTASVYIRIWTDTHGFASMHVCIQTHIRANMVLHHVRNMCKWFWNTYTSILTMLQVCAVCICSYM